MKKITINSPVILGFAVLCAVSYFAPNFLGSQFREQFFSVYQSSLRDPATYIRGVFHICGFDDLSTLMDTLVKLLMVGPLVEEKHKSSKVLITLFLVAISTSIIHCLFFPGVALYGANGVIYALIIMASFTGKKEDGIPLTLILVAAIHLGQQLRTGYFSQNDVYTMMYVVESLVGGFIGLVMVLAK